MSDFISELFNNDGNKSLTMHYSYDEVERVYKVVSVCDYECNEMMEEIKKRFSNFVVHVNKKKEQVWRTGIHAIKTHINGEEDVMTICLIATFNVKKNMSKIKLIVDINDEPIACHKAYVPWCKFDNSAFNLPSKMILENVFKLTFKNIMNEYEKYIDNEFEIIRFFEKLLISSFIAYDLKLGNKIKLVNELKKNIEVAKKQDKEEKQRIKKEKKLAEIEERRKYLAELKKQNEEKLKTQNEIIDITKEQEELRLKEKEEKLLKMQKEEEERKKAERLARHQSKKSGAKCGKEK
jgi:hypothetical protein